MGNRFEITKEQAVYAVEKGELEDSVTGSCRIVVAVFTQDWCPQWVDMKRWIGEIDVEFDLYELVYNKVDYYREFMSFKERKWGNYDVPYLRIYKDGILSKETNYMGRSRLEKLLQEL